MHKTNTLHSLYILYYYPSDYPYDGCSPGVYSVMEINSARAKCDAC